MSALTGLAARRALAVVALGLGGLALAGCSTGDDVFSIKVGDCLNDADAVDEVSTVPIVECAEPHDSEAFAAHDLDDGAYPGQDAIVDTAEELCGPSFVTFIGLDYDASIYDYSYYYPTEESWSNGDREVLCVAYADDASKVTGSIEGSNQ